MPAKKGDDRPVPGIMHGLNGYRRHGCRCFTCRRGNADAVARARARKDEEKVPGSAYVGLRGDRMEILCRSEIIGFGTLNDKAAGLAHLAIITAKLIDQIQIDKSWHLLNATTKRYGELMNDLRAACGFGDRQGMEDDDELLGTLGTFGPPGS